MIAEGHTVKHTVADGRYAVPAYNEDLVGNFPPLDEVALRGNQQLMFDNSVGAQSSIPEIVVSEGQIASLLGRSAIGAGTFDEGRSHRTGGCGICPNCGSVHGGRVVERGAIPYWTALLHVMVLVLWILVNGQYPKT